MTLPAMILAGGSGRRMGGVDKALLPLGDGVVLDAILARLRPQAGPIALNANGDPARFDRFGLPVVPDRLRNVGPLGGVLVALDWAEAQGADQVLVLPADTPFLPLDLVERLSVAPRVAYARSGDDLHPILSIWNSRLRSDLQTFLEEGGRKVRSFLSVQNATPVEFPSSTEDPFFNINTPADLDMAEQRFRASDRAG